MGIRRVAPKLIVALCVSLTGFVAWAGSAAAAGAPVVEEEWAAPVVRSTAVLAAEVNPEGVETTYRFEYGQSTASESSVPTSGATIPPGEGGVEVSQQIVGLQPGTTYHYRVVATNAEGTVDGEDRSFTTFAASSPEPANTCPNAAYRVGFSAGLPDCRAYEMVSPVVKNGGDVSAEAFGQTLASERGERVIFSSKTGFGEESGSGNAGYTQYVAERGAGGWISRGITPLPYAANGGQVFGGKTEVLEFSPDLSTAGVLGYSFPEAPAGGRAKSENLYLENTATKNLFAVITNASEEGEPVPYPSIYVELFGLPGTEEIFDQPVLGGASYSMGVVTFMSRVNYTPEAKGFEYKAYVYEDGTVKLLGPLPDGTTPTTGSSLIYGVDTSGRGEDEEAIAQRDTVSPDGSRILFEAGEFPGQIFMRRTGMKTVLVTESETSEPVTAENVKLRAATPDLKHIVFSTSTRLLDNAPEGGGLYMYTESPDPESESNLTYIGGGGESRVLGMSEDATRIYYANGGYSVQLWDSGQTRQVAPEPGVELYSSLSPGEARVSSDGGELAFMSPAALTSGVQVRPFPTYNESEMYVYQASTDTLTCVSCPSTHAASTLGIETTVEGNSSGTELSDGWEPRFLSRDGRYVFFNTAEALVPQDTNGVSDAYEYDTQTGRLSLLSTGTGEGGTWFVDASASGHDAYLVTRQKLTGWDPDKLVDVYDARVEGGLPEPPPPPRACDGDACQGTPAAAPAFNTASGFTGLGNPSFTPVVKAKPKVKPNKRLRHALAVCRKKRSKRRRTRCERSARRRYGARRSSAHNSRAGR